MRDVPAARSIASSGAPRWVRWVAATISVATHAIVILVYPHLNPEAAPALPPLRVFVPASQDGMQVVQLLELEEAIPEPAPEPEPEVVPAPEQAELPEDASPAVIVADVEVPAGDPRTAAERLRPFMNNPEVWRPIDPELLDLTLEERARFEMAAVLELWIDSITTAEAARVAAMDWTYTDADGGRWGFSPGKIHLGDITLPLPFQFGPNPSRINELRERDWEWMELQRGAVAAAVEQSWKDRARAIRERMDAERAVARGDSVRRPPGT